MNIFWQRNLTALAIGIATLTTFSPQSAEARVVVNTGEELFEVADFPQSMTEKYPRLKDYKVSYLCQRFGIFWANIWTWDCQLMAGSISSKSVIELPPEYAETLKKDYPFEKAERNYWNKYGFLTIVGTLTGLGLLVGLTKKTGNTQTATAAQAEEPNAE